MKQESITSFQGEYRFLSNFWKLQNPVIMGDIEFDRTELAYVAAKTSNHNLRLEIRNMKPGEAKAFGEKIFKENLQPNRWWSDNFRLRLMRDLVHQKFFKNPDLADLLRKTDGCDIIEGNTWHDNFFGVCSCGNCPPDKLQIPPQNHLGKIIMETQKLLMI